MTREARYAREFASLDTPAWGTEPWLPAQGCEMDGYTEDQWGRERYWHCEDAAVTEAGGLQVCARHLRERAA
jgi:hypothetical protein